MNRMETWEKYPDLHGQLIFDIEEKAVQGRKYTLFINCVGKIRYSYILLNECCSYTSHHIKVLNQNES